MTVHWKYWDITAHLLYGDLTTSSTGRQGLSIRFTSVCGPHLFCLHLKVLNVLRNRVDVLTLDNGPKPRCGPSNCDNPPRLWQPTLFYDSTLRDHHFALNFIHLTTICWPHSLLTGFGGLTPAEARVRLIGTKIHVRDFSFILSPNSTLLPKQTPQSSFFPVHENSDVCRTTSCECYLPFFPPPPPPHFPWRISSFHHCNV